MAGEFEGKIIADRYAAERLIAAGALADLYTGRHVLMDKPVTIAVLRRGADDDDRAAYRFFEQAKAAGRIKDANVLDLTDFGTDADGTAYEIYEGVDAGSLRSLIGRAGRLPFTSSLDIARQTAAALAAGHEAGIYHGGLTPDAILVPEMSGSVKVFDFGAPLSAADGRAVYSAPELFNGAAPDVRSDIYSVGVVMFEMLAGEPPFNGETPAEIIEKQAEEPPPPLSSFRSDLPPTIEPVILRAMSKDPEMRQASAAELAAEIYAAASGQAAAQVAAGESTPANNIWKTAFIVLAGIAILSAFLIYTTAGRRTDPTTALQSDANGLPVQPINPATGAEEQNLIVPGLTADQLANSNSALPPSTLPGGDGYNPWANGGTPPPGAPPQQYVPPGGQVYTIDPNQPSQFMPPEGGVILIPVPANTNTAAKPAPSPKTPPANANSAPAEAPKQAEPKTAATPAPKSVPQTEQKPAKKPAGNKPAGPSGADNSEPE